MSEEASNPKSAAKIVLPSRVNTSSQTFSMLLKAVLIKIDAITKLNNDSRNFNIWVAEIMDYLTFIPNATESLNPGAVPTVKGYVEYMENGVNNVMH